MDVSKRRVLRQACSHWHAFKSGKAHATAKDAAATTSDSQGSFLARALQAAQQLSADEAKRIINGTAQHPKAGARCVKPHGRPAPGTEPGAAQGSNNDDKKHDNETSDVGDLKGAREPRRDAEARKAQSIGASLGHLYP